MIIAGTTDFAARGASGDSSINVFLPMSDYGKYTKVKAEFVYREASDIVGVPDLYSSTTNLNFNSLSNHLSGSMGANIDITSITNSGKDYLLIWHWYGFSSSGSRKSFIVKYTFT